MVTALTYPADLSDLKFESVGEISPDDADDANIPVDIWLKPPREHEVGEDETSGHRTQWLLTADNYMPRRGRLSGEHAYKVYADDRETLVAIVHRCWLPLFQKAVEKLTKLETDSDGIAKLYYWD